MEDGQPCLLRAAMDAIRIHDGKRVMLKKVLPEEGPHELQISRMFSARGVATNSRNHCVPLLDAIKLPNSGQQLMVMPFLRPFDNPHFQSSVNSWPSSPRSVRYLRFRYPGGGGNMQCTTSVNRTIPFHRDTPSLATAGIPSFMTVPYLYQT
ncbi:hypothetical protein EDB85DRAFT_880141 [Lactarius pseudohatsudake]|nr:hypothetical protein EDB85DRAFT_880141 [Lactarius pseudohatsudake]